MKIGIVTLHRVRNYGSVLQAYALVRLLKAEGHSVEIIDYIPERFRLRSDLFFVRKDRYTDKNGKKNIAKRFVLSCASVIPRYYYYTRFSGFVKKWIPLSNKSYYDNEELKRENLDYDIVMNGSDQVWNMAWEKDVDLAFFLDFVGGNTPKMAYAASFGKKELTQREKEIMGPLLKKYSLITMREDSGVNLLRDLGIPNGRHVLDPTLVLNREMWLELTGDRIIRDKYVVIYQLNYNTKAIEHARRIADVTGLKVVELSRKVRKSIGVDINLPFVKPETFLNALAYADYVVTDSFHGTAFSINFNRQFISIRNNFPERVGSLVRLVGLENRFVPMDEELDIDNALSVIEYKNVNRILDMERSKARDIIREMTKKA